MSLTDRDRKLLMFLIPVAVVVGYWMLVLSPQRSELSKLDSQLTTVETQRDDAQNKASQLQQSKSQYASDYATVVRLGKAIPVDLAMPSLLVQLDSAAKGTGIDFDSITAGTRISAATTSTGSSSGGSGSSGAPVAAGGEQAQTGTGKPVEQANEAGKTSDDANKARGADQPAAGAASPSGGGVAGLDTVPLNFTFNGGYFELADFLHRIKRFVRVANDDLNVKGRLMTVDGLTLRTTSFPRVTAEITANVYLAPKTQGATGGATPQGPAATPASTQTPTPAPASPQSAAPTSSPGSGTVR